MSDQEKNSKARRIADAWGVTQVVKKENDDVTGKPNQKNISDAMEHLHDLVNGEDREILDRAKHYIQGNDNDPDPKIALRRAPKPQACPGTMESITLAFG